MWDVCGWSGSVVMLVFTPYVHTYGGVNEGVNETGGGVNTPKPPPYTCQVCVWAPCGPLGIVWNSSHLLFAGKRALRRRRRW